MQHDINHLKQAIGFVIPDWTPPPFPTREPLEGRFCRLEPLDPEVHAASLFAANALDTENRQWTYLAYGPFDTLESYRAWMEATCQTDDPLFYAIVDRATGEAVGVGSYLRIEPRNGTIEIGHLNFSLLMQRTPLSTEALFLMIDHAFALGYRRCEWKCNALNMPSRAAAQRLGFSYEGIFRQATVSKGRNRDTAWYAIIDKEWPALREAFHTWLAPENFDGEGKQRTRLSELTEPLLYKRG